MKTVALFRQLSFGELSNLSISNSGSGEIIEAKQPQIIHYVNDALLALHTRFLLSEKSLVLEQAAAITMYHIKRRYTVSSGSNVTIPYIKDTVEDPFQDDFIRIMSVWDTEGNQKKINDSEDSASLFTPQPHILQIPEPVEGEQLTLIYQANHAKLDDRIDGPNKILNQIIDIPIYLENPLRLYVAHKVFSHMNGQENIIKSQEYLGAYEAACLEIEQCDLVNQTFHTSHNKLEQRGFA